MAGRCPEGDQDPRASIWPVGTLIATREAAGGAAAGPECIKCGIGEREIGSVEAPRRQ